MADTWLALGRLKWKQYANGDCAENIAEMMADFGKLVKEEAQVEVICPKEKFVDGQWTLCSACLGVGKRKRTEAEVLAAVRAQLEKR